MHTYAFDEHIQRKRGKRRRALLAILLGASIATLGAGAMSLAVFTDSDAVDGQWTTGSIVLLAEPSAGFTVNGVVPGDDGDQDITVANNGSVDLRYAMTTSGNAFAAEFNLTIYEGTCSAATGTVLYDGALDTAYLGDPAQGADLGDREVNAGDPADALCFHWELPLDTDTAFMGDTADATFTFDAEQTDNNP